MSSWRKFVVKPETEEGGEAPVSILNVPDTQESMENGSGRPQRIRTLPYAIGNREKGSGPAVFKIIINLSADKRNSVAAGTNKLELWYY